MQVSNPMVLLSQVPLRDEVAPRSDPLCKQYVEPSIRHVLSQAPIPLLYFISKLYRNIYIYVILYNIYCNIYIYIYIYSLAKASSMMVTSQSGISVLRPLGYPFKDTQCGATQFPRPQFAKHDCAHAMSVPKHFLGQLVIRYVPYCVPLKAFSNVFLLCRLKKVAHKRTCAVCLTRHCLDVNKVLNFCR